jgi:hypothetical protein
MAEEPIFTGANEPSILANKAGHASTILGGLDIVVARDHYWFR